MSNERSFTAFAWNVRDGLADPKTASAIANVVAKIKPAIAVFGEAAPSPESVDVATNLFFRDGLRYWTAHALYNDEDDRLDRHGLYMIASRAIFQRPERFRAAGRTCMSAVTLDGELGFVGMHGFDRDQSSKGGHDKKRIRQMKEVVGHLGEIGVAKAVIGGDLNSMLPNQRIARMLGMAVPLTRLLPYKNPREQQTATERFGSLANRLSQMALGGPITYLQSQGFIHADPEARGTMHFGPIHADLDHFFGWNVEMNEFTLHPPESLSDHDAISVMVRY